MLAKRNKSMALRVHLCGRAEESRVAYSLTRPASGIFSVSDVIGNQETLRLGINRPFRSIG